MLLLFETSAGYALFKVLQPKKLNDTTNLWKEFLSIDTASSIVKLKSFVPFQSTTEAVVAATSIIEGTLDKSLKKFLKKTIINKDIKDELAVADIKLGGLIKEKMDIQCIYNDSIMELYRGIRTQMDNLITTNDDDSNNDNNNSALKQMQLGLSHSLSRYKLKFSADKVDIMIVQAIGLLDDLDKEINIYAMRVREWYGWHFPEMAKILNDNLYYARCVLRMGMRNNCKNCDFSDILSDEGIEQVLKKTAETSMGTEISDGDLMNIKSLCDQVISLTEYRLQLYEYLKNRMSAIAPNLTMMVGELVGARLIAHSGSLINLAKQPASTIQILGAEKALFRALKTKTDTPKYGLIYHASLIGQAAPKNKGKISRVLAAKTALAIRVDALGDNDGPTIAYDNKLKVEARIRQLEGGQKVNMAAIAAGASSSSTSSGPARYDPVVARTLAPPKYNATSDLTLTATTTSQSRASILTNTSVIIKEKKEKKRDHSTLVNNNNGGDNEEEEEEEVKVKKAKTKLIEIVESIDVTNANDNDDNTDGNREKVKKQKKKSQEVIAEVVMYSEEKKKKKKKDKDNN